MALLSPGVQVKQVDLSVVVPKAGDSTAVFGGNFEKGPVGYPVLISSVQELKDIFGLPNKENYNEWYQVWNFLQYSGAIFVARAADLNGTPKKLDATYDSNDHKLETQDTELNVQIQKNENDKIIVSKTTLLSNGDMIRINGTPEVFQVLGVEDTQIEVDNPAYQELTELSVNFDRPDANIIKTESFQYSIDTEADDYEISTNHPEFILINKSLKTITGVEAGTADITIKAQKDGKRQKVLSLEFTVKEMQETRLVLSDSSKTVSGADRNTPVQITVDTDAGDYTYELIDTSSLVDNINKSGNTLTINLNDGSNAEGNIFIEVKATQALHTESTKVVEITYRA